MRLTILGCSGGVPGPDSPASGYLLESGDTRITLDLGNGTVGSLQRYTDPCTLDAVLLSHLHPDHCADIAGLTVLRKYHPKASQGGSRMPLFAPPEGAERLAALYAASPSELADTDLSELYDFRPPPVDPVRIGPFEVRAVPMNHVVPSWGFRVSAEGRTLAYTGDTGPCDELVELARDADVLLSEASWTDSDDAPPNVHLSGRQAAEVARDAGVGRLLLTHLLAWSDRAPVLAEARERFEAAEFVEPFRTYDLS